MPPILVRGAVRRLRRRPADALLAGLLLMLAVAPALASLFAAVELLLRPLPFPESRRLVFVFEHTRTGGLSRLPLSEASYLLCRDTARSFDGLAAFHRTAVNLAGSGSRPERVPATRATFDLASVLRDAPALGRWFTLAEESTPAAPVVVISWGLWQRSLGGRSEALGSTLLVDGEPREIVGVMPRGFAFPDVEVRLWLPMGLDRASPGGGSHHLRVIGRLAPGRTVEGAASELASLVPRLTESHPDSYPQDLLEEWGFSMSATPLAEHLTAELRPALLSTLGAATLLLVVAGASSTSILLARNESRRSELAIAGALGASRRQILVETLGEPLVIALAGCTAGYALAPMLLPALGTVMATRALPAQPSVLDPLGQVLGAAVAMTTATAVALAAALPLVYRGVSSPTLRSAASPGGVTLRRLLVVGQLALTLALVSAEVELLRRWGSLRALDPGFRTEDVLTFRISLPEAVYPSPASVRSFVQRLLDRLDTSPDVLAAGATTELPLGGRRNLFAVWIEGRDGRPREQPEMLPMRLASDDYFTSLGIPILQGRSLSRFETGVRPREVVVDRSFAERFWPGESAIGRHVATASGEPLEVVGVVGSTHWAGVERTADPIVYFPMSELQSRSLVFTLHTDRDPLAVLPQVRHMVAEIDPDLPLAATQSLEQLHRRSLGPLVPLTRAVAGAALVAAVLATSGTAALLAAVVLSRRRELALRLALGAQPFRVQRLVLAEGARLAAGGLLVGSALAAVTTPLLRRALSFDEALDPWPFFVAALCLAASALVGAVLPATAASRIDPARALRDE